jgi:16S rRNA (guanine1516-N2)-methyltransferase
MCPTDDPLDKFLVVTTSQSAGPDLCDKARAWAQRMNGRYVPREGRGLAKLCAAEGVTGVLVAGGERLEYVIPDEDIRYFHHLGLSRLRLHNLDSGRGDPMLTAMALEPGCSVLDCTLGRGADAVIAATAVGAHGRVLGIEVVPVIAALTADGLSQVDEPGRIAQAARRIEVRCADYERLLPRAESKSFDVVYFDPVFEQPVAESVPMIPLRRLADKRRLTPEALAEARRVARRRVVVKHNRDASLWAELGITELVAGGHSRVAYGVVEAG